MNVNECSRGSNISWSIEESVLPSIWRANFSQQDRRNAHFSYESTCPLRPSHDEGIHLLMSQRKRTVLEREVFLEVTRPCASVWSQALLAGRGIRISFSLMKLMWCGRYPTSDLAPEGVEYISRQALQRTEKNARLTKVRINWKEVCGPRNSILTGHIFTFFEFCLILFYRYRSLNLFNLILVLIQPID